MFINVTSAPVPTGTVLNLYTVPAGKALIISQATVFGSGTNQIAYGYNTGSTQYDFSFYSDSTGREHIVGAIFTAGQSVYAFMNIPGPNRIVSISGELVDN